jgi:hypothetical protein
MDALERLDRFLDDYNTAPASRALVLRQDADADVSRQPGLVKEKQSDPANLVRAACVYHCDR